MKSRHRLSTLHGLIGILGGLLLVVMGLTGSAIVFHQEIDRALNPDLMQVVPQGKPVAIEAFWSSVQTYFPDSRLESIQLPQAPSETYQLQFTLKDKTAQDLFVHPYTGAILGDRQPEHTLIGILYKVHHDFFVGHLGLYLVGISGLILIVQAITGLVLWTGWRKLASGFHIRWRAPFQLLSFDLHNVGGIISNVFLLVTGFTGVIIVGAHILLEPPAIAELPPPFQTAIPLSELIRSADRAMPEGKTMSISFPDPQTIVVTKQLPQDHPRFYFSSVTLDGSTGNVLEVNKVVEPPAMWKFLIPIAELHFGTFGGLPTRIVYLLIGWMPVLLLVTGLMMWRRRRLKGKREGAIDPLSKAR
jgi:uncharacterized iron-regulated membrane protein